MTVLYADNDLDDIDMFRDMLEAINTDWQMVPARNGQEALDILMDTLKLPDLIILDVNMPIMDEPTCLRLIKEQDRLRNIPVIIYSSSRNLHDSLLSYQLSAVIYLQKPFTYKEGIDQLSTVFAKL